MRKLKSVFAVSVALVLALSFIGCGAATAEAVIDDQAAVRGLDERAGEIYIDDEAIALAESAASSIISTSATIDSSLLFSVLMHIHKDCIKFCRGRNLVLNLLTFISVFPDKVHIIKLGKLLIKCL